jgi:hypothetical protein
MTQEEFISILDNGGIFNGYSYEIEGDQIVVTHKGDVWLNYLTSLPPDVEFRNEGHVYLSNLTSLSPGVKFSNGGGIDLKSLLGGAFGYWKGNIEGIDEKRLLNKMIKDGVFER